MIQRPLISGMAILALAPILTLSFPRTAPADEHVDETRTFTAERVFDLEYGDDPQISPNGETIVYVRRSMDRLSDRIRGDLWTLDVDSGAHRPLVVGGASATNPRWSPNGDRLLYTTTAEGRPELRLLFLDSGQGMALAQFTEAPRQATWSPDGSTIAFAMFVKGEAPSFSTPLTAPEGASWSEPVRVFDDITFRFDGQGYLSAGETQVFTIPAEGGTPRQVTRGDGGYDQPAWLKGGTLVVTGNPNEDRDLDPIESDLFAVDLASLEMTRLTDRDGPDNSATPSPDGSLIAYLGYDDELKSWQQTRLYIMNADGSGSRQLATNFDREFGDLAWRADGRALYALREILERGIEPFAQRLGTMVEQHFRILGQVENNHTVLVGRVGGNGYHHTGIAVVTAIHPGGMEDRCHLLQVDVLEDFILAPQFVKKIV